MRGQIIFVVVVVDAYVCVGWDGEGMGGGQKLKYGVYFLFTRFGMGGRAVEGSELSVIKSVAAGATSCCIVDNQQRKSR